MGCVLCNLIHLSEEQEAFPSESARQDFMNELAGDIAQYHPELVEKINDCVRRAGGKALPKDACPKCATLMEPDVAEGGSIWRCPHCGFSKGRGPSV